MSKNKKGFTLIELMVVIVIVGIIAAIAIPNFVKIVARAKEAEVRANMHTTQLVVEYYCIESDGNQYPSSIVLVFDELPPGIRNPYDPAGPAVQDESGTDVEGVVEYETESPNLSYTITGLGKDAVPINFFLTQGIVE